MLRTGEFTKSFVYAIAWIIDLHSICTCPKAMETVFQWGCLLILMLAILAITNSPRVCQDERSLWCRKPVWPEPFSSGTSTTGISSPIASWWPGNTAQQEAVDKLTAITATGGSKPRSLSRVIGDWPCFFLATSDQLVGLVRDMLQHHFLLQPRRGNG